MENYITNILIVDDTKANLISLRAILEDPEIILYEAGSGNEALKILLKEKIDVVLLDVQMPDINGFEVARLMRGNIKTMNIPIIFITAINKEEKYIFKGYELGAVDYLYKPIHNEILKSKVKVFVKLNRQTKIIEAKSKELQKKITQLKIVEKKLSHMARVDELTGAYNRRAFEEVFRKEWARAIRSKTPIAILMIDIDNFKKFNDTYGHLEGDNCLKQVVAVITSSLNRPFDEVARFGGEEFVVVLPDTDQNGGKTVAENIRENIEKLQIKNEGVDNSQILTVSIGIASTIPIMESARKDLLDQSDKALYRAKTSGRNKTCF